MTTHYNDRKNIPEGKVATVSTTECRGYFAGGGRGRFPAQYRAASTPTLVDCKSCLKTLAARALVAK